MADSASTAELLSWLTVNTVLGALRVGLHVMVAILLFFGVLRAGLGAHLWLVAAFGGVYLAGTVVERRRVIAGQPVPRGPQRAWLGMVTVLWLGLMLCSPDFMWLEFPLAFLFLALLPRIPGVVAAVALWALAVTLGGAEHVAAVIGPAIGTIFAVAIYFAYSALHDEAEKHRRIAEELRATQAELAASEHQAGRLEERERLSREIHDTVAQGLSSIVLLSRAARQDPSLLGLIEETASTNLDEARRFVRDLASPGLPLPEALDQLVSRMRTRGAALEEPTEFHLNVEGSGNVPDSVASACLRVAQEGLNNVVKHADATKAVVTLGLFDDAVTVDVVDNGRGFSGGVSGGPNGGHSFGLSGLERRVAALGGTMEVESTPGAGTALAVRIPLTSQKEEELNDG